VSEPAARIGGGDRVEGRLAGLRPCGMDPFGLPLRRVDGLFFRGKRSRSSARHSVGRLTRCPVAAAECSSSSVKGRSGGSSTHWRSTRRRRPAGSHSRTAVLDVNPTSTTSYPRGLYPQIPVVHMQSKTDLKSEDNGFTCAECGASIDGDDHEA
jgi:hypothetical protein